MGATPYYTSNDLIASVKRKIAFPVAQNTFLETDILAFANEEMFISQVPSVLQFHEEYFVHYVTVPLQTNLSRYPIPDRATGMKLRDLFWQDQNGNLFEMTRIEEHDKAFFQANIGSNQAVHKFYPEGNDVVLVPGVSNAPTGSLVFVFYLRPNQLVKNERAAIIAGFNQTVKINKSLILPLDTFSLDGTIFTAINTAGGTITAITSYSTLETKITSTAHQLSTGQTITISGSNSNPNIDGTYIATVLDANNFIIPFQIGVAGTTGTFTCTNQFLIAATDALTASNLATSINNIGDQSATVVNNIITLFYPDIHMTITTSNAVGFLITQNTIGVQFTSLPSTYTDPETNITTPLFQNLVLIDFLKTKPGHNTFIYDVEIPNNGISGTSVFFTKDALLVPTGTINNNGGSSGPTVGNTVQYIIADLKVGDYICLANECIIPQIPPDLHNGLAERTSARILAALGDQQGLQVSMAKIQEIETRQGNLLDNRSEGTPQKVVNRHSQLRYGKMGTTRRT